MAQLTIIYDELDPPVALRVIAGVSIRQAVMPLASGLGDVDIYEVARRLAELLLEQLGDR